jgi:hypothetical protein
MPRRFDAEELDDDFPRREPKRRSSPWLIPGIVAGFLLLGGVLLLAGLFTARRQVQREREEMFIARAEAESAQFHADQAGRKPLEVVAAAEVVDVQALARAYRSNEADANAKYAKREVQFRGVMHHCEKIRTGGYVMGFEYSVDGAKPAQGIVYAYFPATESEKLSQLQHRSPVQFTGRCDGWVRTTAPPMVAIRDCRIDPGP